MAKIAKFETNLLVEELYRMGSANKAKGKYLVSKVTNLATSWVRLNPATTNVLSLSEVAESLRRQCIARTRMTKRSTDKSNQLRLSLVMKNVKLDIIQTFVGNGQAQQIRLNFSGELTEPIVGIVSTNQMIDFLIKVDDMSARWMSDWEKMLFKGWHSANIMSRATDEINQYLMQRIDNTGLKFSFSLGVGKSKVSILLPRGLALSALVPNDDFEYQVDLLISQALVINAQLSAMPDEISIEKI